MGLDAFCRAVMDMFSLTKRKKRCRCSETPDQKSKDLKNTTTIKDDKRYVQNNAPAQHHPHQPSRAPRPETPGERHARLQRAITKIHCPSGRNYPQNESCLSTSPYLEVKSKINAARNTREAEKCEWYWGYMNSAQAEGLLAEQEEGTFLLRQSMNSGYLFTLSCKFAGRVGHIRIEYRDCIFTFCRWNGLYESDSVLELVERAMQVSRLGYSALSCKKNDDPNSRVDVLLLYPLLRKKVVPPLKELCVLALARLNRRDSLGMA